MVGENQQETIRFPFPEGAGDESAVRAPYSAIKVACSGKFAGKLGGNASFSSHGLGERFFCFQP